jgi:hypothetical protein
MKGNFFHQGFPTVLWIIPSTFWLQLSRHVEIAAVARIAPTLLSTAFPQT